MLLGRRFKSEEAATLYHYCSPDTFHAICTNKSLRFSDVYSMNDFMEMHWGYKQWENCANDLAPELGNEFLNSVDEILSHSSLRFTPLASCFSIAGDSLSQGRAYAQNGKGFAFGFDSSSLCEFAATPLKILYSDAEQIEELKQFIRVLHKIHSEDEDINELVNICATLSADLCAFKNPSFSEEKEVRLLRLVNFKPSKEFFSLADPGGNHFGHTHNPSHVQFNMKGSIPAPFVDLSFLNAENEHCIREVVLGPKNEARASAISVYLETMGLGGIQVKRSSASYR